LRVARVNLRPMSGSFPLRYQSNILPP
jgi:hypothetical protein